MGVECVDVKPDRNKEATGLGRQDGNADKVWSYAEITATVEAEIRRLMQAPAVTPMDASRNHAWAYGIYRGWALLTQGYQKREDDERLHKLTRVRL
ncbi:hypothetical protein LMG23994_05555 [Cupriavidus pinatubonensis]|uniref:Uncharacterized protein n=1 Tax=Cupriavidus pinatubonensis TaxID=248026 RepID=A0ABN7ZIX4_9BURK|nr:hypothetical protein LMG23994_05555 [Cupriavidus pinatubonensis]